MKKMNEHIVLRTGSTAVREAESKLRKMLRHLRLSDSEEHNLLVASSEAVNNAVSHGNKNNHSKKISLDVGYLNGEVSVSVEDEGGGFNPDALPDPLSPENLLKPSGRGILIMKSLMDDVDFQFTPYGTRTILKLKINRQGKNKSSADG